MSEVSKPHKELDFEAIKKFPPEGCDHYAWLHYVLPLVEQYQALDDAIRDALDFLTGWNGQGKVDPGIAVGILNDALAKHGAQLTSNPASEPCAWCGSTRHDTEYHASGGASIASGEHFQEREPE